ncbi:MAG: hypothetical protein Q8J80_09845 [Gallionella sp.]|nr:hypothetical protein [Gallionella sp.]
MIQSAPGVTAPSIPTLAQHRAYRFVIARIEAVDTSPFYAGYIHGLIQALTMAGAITVKQACDLEQIQETASCDAFNRRAVGGAA